MFESQVAIVTGSGKGIGREIILELAAKGAKVVVTDINSELLQSTVEEARALGADAIGVIADVSKVEDVKSIIAQTIEAFGSIDLVVNNAGVVRDMKITDMEEEDWNFVVDIVQKGAFLVTKYAAPYLIEQQSGKIVNIASRAYLGNPGQANYSSAKSGIVGLTKALAKELGRYNINVNAVAPGLIETDAIRNHPKYEDMKERQKRDTPLRRIGQTKDVANAVLFLLSDQSSYITGDVLHVTGGRFG